MGPCVILPHLLIQSAMKFCHRLHLSTMEVTRSMVEKVHFRNRLIIDISKYIMGRSIGKREVGKTEDKVGGSLDILNKSV